MANQFGEMKTLLLNTTADHIGELCMGSDMAREICGDPQFWSTKFYIDNLVRLTEPTTTDEWIKEYNRATKIAEYMKVLHGNQSLVIESDSKKDLTAGLESLKIGMTDHTFFPTILYVISCDFPDVGCSLEIYSWKDNYVVDRQKYPISEYDVHVLIYKALGENLPLHIYNEKTLGSPSTLSEMLGKINSPGRVTSPQRRLYFTPPSERVSSPQMSPRSPISSRASPPSFPRTGERTSIPRPSERTSILRSPEPRPYYSVPPPTVYPERQYPISSQTSTPTYPGRSSSSPRRESSSESWRSSSPSPRPRSSIRSNTIVPEMPSRLENF